ncbi:Programmed cell death protein 6 [Mortierella sp. GBA39]|nr:Programmed cell death protein 6 [Mortierella sp. GBA39]
MSCTLKSWQFSHTSSKMDALSSGDLSIQVVSSAYSSQIPMRGHHNTYSCTTNVNPPVGEAENNTHRGYSSDSEIFPTESPLKVSTLTANHATADADGIPSPPEAQTPERHQLTNKAPVLSRGSASPTAATAQVPPVHSTVIYLPHNIFLADARAPTVSDAAGVPALDTAERAWLSAMREDPPAQAHILWLISKLVAEFVKDASMGSAAISEVVILGPALRQWDYRFLLSCLIERFNLAVLLNVDLLQGLVQLVQCAPSDCLTEDDMVRIIMSVQRRLESTHASSREHVYQLVFAISKILEVMVTGDVKNQSRQWDHQSFLEVLRGMSGGEDDTLLKFQVDYAYQTLLYLPDDETSWQAFLRNAQSAAVGVSAVACVFKLDPMNALAAVKHLQQVAGHTIDVVKFNIDAAPAFQAIAQGGSQAAERMLQKKEAWFLTLQAAHVFVREGRLVEFNTLVCEAPCRFEVNFQYGICLILGEIIVSQLWDFDSRVSAIDFLGELYNVEAGRKNNFKIQMLVASILSQISKMSLPGVSMHAGVRLSNLQENQFTDTEDCHLVQTRLPPPTKFPLLGRVLDIPHVEYDLDCMKFRRLGEGHCPIFIPLRAKETSLDPDNSFLLMEKVKRFLESDRRVFLLLGDSGSGKSMFCRQLERELWNDYKVGSRIPLFINLPSIDQPERNLIEEHLCKHNNISADRVHEIKGRQLVLICDSYDEARLITNLYTTNRLSELKVKMVISCRNTFLSRGYDGRFRPYEADRFHDRSSDLFEEATILPFTDSDIKDYIMRFVMDPAAAVFLGNISVLSQKIYLERLSVFPKLMDLAKNPFLLTLALKALPSLPTDTLDSSDPEVLQLGLYHGFIHEWIRFSKERLHRVRLSPEVQDGFDELLEADFWWCVKDYSKRLAEAIYLHQEGRPVVNYTHLKDEKTWKVEFFGREIKRTLLREASPLTRAGIQHWFIHKSLLDYFVSLEIYDPDDYSHEDYGDDGGDDFGHGGGDNRGGGGSAHHDGRSDGLGDDGGEPAHGVGGSSRGNNGTSESSGTSSGGSGGSSGGGGGSSGGGDGSSGGNRDSLGGRKRSHSEGGGSDAGKDGFSGDEDDPRRRKEDFHSKKKARMDGSRASDSSGLISKLNLFKEPAVIWFLVVRARTDVRFKKILLSTIEQSRSSVGPSLAAANAITILFKSGERFQHVDLDDVRVPRDYMSEETAGYVPLANGSLTGIELMDALMALQTSPSISKESVRSEIIPTTLLTPWSPIIDETSASISLREAPPLYSLKGKDKVEMTSEGQHDTVKKHQQYQQAKHQLQQAKHQLQQQLDNIQRRTGGGQQTVTVQSSLRAWFDAVDTDHSGTLSCEELQRALMNGDWAPLNVETVCMMMDMFDQDNDGTISFNEFIGLWNYIEKWKQCFQSYDLDGSGTIDAMELQMALQGFGYNLPAATVQLIVTKYDVRGRGDISFDSFVQSCVTINTLTSAFRRIDVAGAGVVTMTYEQVKKKQRITDSDSTLQMAERCKIMKSDDSTLQMAERCKILNSARNSTLQLAERKLL